MCKTFLIFDPLVCTSMYIIGGCSKANVHMKEAYVEALQRLIIDHY